VLLGAQLLVNVTNDGWFGHSAANRQQMSEAVFRAVENRRPLVSCANTGVTAFVDRDGRITRSLRMPNGSVFGRGLLSGVVPVPANPSLTFYTRHGEAFSGACAAACGLMWFFAAWRRLRRLRWPRHRGRKSVEDGSASPAES
jgi:apolipoprotein N-acyltransferase